MTRNHRVLAFKQDITGLPPALAKKYKNYIDLRICEVHYYPSGRPRSYGQPPNPLGAESIKDLSWRLNKMKLALKKPILWGDKKFPKEYKK